MEATVWKLKAPPKVKDFLWRACTHCLPTADQLRMKNVPIPEGCVLCDAEGETIMHVLVQCSFAKECIRSISVEAGEVQANSFVEWIERVGDRVGKEKFEAVAVVCWSIWKSRNEKVWKGKVLRTSEVVSTSMTFLHQWKAAQRADTCVNFPMAIKGDGARIWTKPQGNVIKVNVDAAIFEDINCFGVGFAARDDKGELIEAHTIQRIGRVGAELAEALGIREALSWIKEKRWGSVIVESDSQVCVSAIRNPYKMESPFGIVIGDCQELLRCFVDVSLFFVYRSANGVAHSLARASRSFPGRCFSGRDVPVDLLTRILDESH